MLDSLYGQVMRARRRRMERHPQRQRHLSKPVISVGNLSMGGTGKTPVVAAIAQWLIGAGHRPSILSRGYGREDAVDGVVLIDGATTVAQAGDEPLMLSRQVPGATVCVSPDRYLGGVLAEKLGCTVHVLDDGFQHIELARDLDILVTTIGEIPNGRVLPRGRLREPQDAAARAHFLVVSDATAGAASAEAWTLGISQSCGSIRKLGEPSGIRDQGSGVRDRKVLAVAGIANPERFVTSLRDGGWNVVEVMAFGDHHRYSPKDLIAIESKMRSAGADAVFTTDKDAVRVESLTLSLPIYRVPLIIEFDPPAALFESVKAVVN
ncbi:MAG TPA: tetraacyldisaccharide 4'-kinase [Vicinamibacterales bacterium]|nr:tetraacyldisaccharide 4'-kinase [Vicinamibacterales bacterium]